MITDESDVRTKMYEFIIQAIAAKTSLLQANEVIVEELLSSEDMSEVFKYDMMNLVELANSELDQVNALLVSLKRNLKK